MSQPSHFQDQVAATQQEAPFLGLLGVALGRVLDTDGPGLLICLVSKNTSMLFLSFSKMVSIK